MSDKPSVVLTLAGDETRLTQAFNRVGAASKSMSDDVSSSSKSITDSGSKFDGYAEKTDTAETRSQGFADVLTGAKDAMSAWGDESLSTSDKLVALGQAGADLAGGFTNFLIPAIGNLAGNLRGGLASAMTFISAHPLLITVGLLAAAFVLLWVNSEKFRDIVIGVFNTVGDFAKRVFGGAIDWIVGAWNYLVDWFRRLPERIGQAFSAVGGFIGDAFKGGLNLVIDYVNFFVRTINWLTDKINDVTGVVGIPSIPAIPQIPRLHTGGVFRAAGGEGLALLRDGETVSAPGQGGPAGPFQLSVPLVEQIQAWLNDGSLVLVGR